MRSLLGDGGADDALPGGNKLFEPDAAYTTDLFGDAVPSPAGRRSDGRVRASARVGSVDAKPAVSGGLDAPPGTYATRTRLVMTRNQPLGQVGPVGAHHQPPALGDVGSGRPAAQREPR